jgi:hypothetical protein
MASKYTDDYLNNNDERGLGRGLTPGSYLNSQLRGTAKRYAAKYRAALESDLRARVVEGSVLPYASQGGAVAYYSIATVDACRAVMLAELGEGR